MSSRLSEVVRLVAYFTCPNLNCLKQVVQNKVKQLMQQKAAEAAERAKKKLKKGGGSKREGTVKKAAESKPGSAQDAEEGSRPETKCHNIMS